MQGMIMSWNRVNNGRVIPSVTLAPLPLSLKRMMLQLAHLTGKLLFDWRGCVVTVTLDTVYYGAPEEITCGPRVSDQWTNSSRKTNV